jgi:hypothetical protein
MPLAFRQTHQTPQKLLIFVCPVTLGYHTFIIQSLRWIWQAIPHIPASEAVIIDPTEESLR